MFTAADGVKSLILFERLINDNGDRICSTPWTSKLYESFHKQQTHGHIVLVYFYSDGVTLSKSGTQFATFLCVHFFNIEVFNEPWFTAAIAPIYKKLHPSLPAERVRHLKLTLIQRFMFLLFADRIKSSYTKVVLYGVTLFPRICMVIVDQPEERALICLKCHESCMDCSNYILWSRVTL